MCVAKTPKVPAVNEKKPQYLRNPFLDGAAIQIGSRGRNSLRVDRGAPAGRLNTTPSGLPEPLAPVGPVVPKDLNNGRAGGVRHRNRIPGIGIPNAA